MSDERGATLNQKERIAAAKTARIIRAARKQLSLTQTEVAAHLGVSQSALSKLENGILVPSAPQWFDFCRMTGISTESLLTGVIERNRPAALENGSREGTFKLPKKYATDRGSKVRAMLPFLTFLKTALGERKAREFIKSMKLDPDFFVDLDHQISLGFCLDVSRYLIRERLLKPKSLSALTKTVSLPETHGSLQLKYNQAHGTSNLLQVLLLSSRQYECNFKYQIEHIGPASLDVSITPEKHLERLSYRNDPELGNFLCQYKRSYFEHFMQYRNGARVKPDAVQELECHYTGNASRCVYQIRVEN